MYHNTVIEGESYRLSGVPDLYMIEISLLINKTILSLAIPHMKLDLDFVYLKTPDIWLRYTFSLQPIYSCLERPSLYFLDSLLREVCIKEKVLCCRCFCHLRLCKCGLSLFKEQHGDNSLLVVQGFGRREVKQHC